MIYIYSKHNLCSLICNNRVKIKIKTLTSLALASTVGAVAWLDFSSLSWKIMNVNLDRIIMK